MNPILLATIALADPNPAADAWSEAAVVLADEATAEQPDPVKWAFHGFRLGYAYVNTPEKKKPVLDSPHLFVIGYEATQRVVGGSWLNVIVVENGSISGINQSLFIPSVNGLVGFEIDEQVQIGTGINVNPFDQDGRMIHQIIALGWTPPAGAFNVPFHVTFIPDVEGAWRVGTTVGVNW